ncbi:MAG: hypothetical protein A4E27_00766 [Methanobacterium sp. PtaU1.Bin242]|nr:MAG: hypothetical protein A4E27_00766 [Methanobacterium sp. PtaU1.Bin242]
MYQERVYRNDVLNKMDNVLQRFRFLLRSRSIPQDKIETIDYHLGEIMEVLNDCSH